VQVRMIVEAIGEPWRGVG